MLLIEIQIPIGIELYVKETMNVTLKSVKIKKIHAWVDYIICDSLSKRQYVITLHMHDLIQTNII